MPPIQALQPLFVGKHNLAAAPNTGAFLTPMPYLQKPLFCAKNGKGGLRGGLRGGLYLTFGDTLSDTHTIPFLPF